MDCFLFAWNPKNWKWADLEDDIQQIDNAGSIAIGWSLIISRTARVSFHTCTEGVYVYVACTRVHRAGQAVGRGYRSGEDLRPG